MTPSTPCSRPSPPGRTWWARRSPCPRNTVPKQRARAGSRYRPGRSPRCSGGSSDLAPLPLAAPAVGEYRACAESRTIGDAMPATALPSSGDQPHDNQAQRREDLRRERHGGDPPDVPRRLRGGAQARETGVREGDTPTRRRRRPPRTAVDQLHAHHEGEDLKLWDWIDDRAPSCTRTSSA